MQKGLKRYQDNNQVLTPSFKFLSFVLVQLNILWRELLREWRFRMIFIASPIRPIAAICLRKETETDRREKNIKKHTAEEK